MGEAPNAVLELPASSSTKDAGNNDAAETTDLEKQPEQGTEIPEDIAGATQARVEDKPTHGTNPSSPATPPETPERSASPLQTAEHAHADEAAPDVDTVKPDDCTTPPPPAHGSEGSDTQSADDDHGSSRRQEPKPAGAASGAKQDVAASKSRLLAFRSFSRDKKVKKSSGDAAPPEAGRAPSPGEHRPAHGKAGEEGADHKEKGKERRKRFWK